MHHAFNPRLDNDLISHGARKENNGKGGERQWIYKIKNQNVNSKITNQNSKQIGAITWDCPYAGMTPLYQFHLKIAERIIHNITGKPGFLLSQE